LSGVTAFVCGLIEEATQAAATPPAPKPRVTGPRAQAQELVPKARSPEPVPEAKLPELVAGSLVREPSEAVAAHEDPPRSDERGPTRTTEGAADPVPSPAETSTPKPVGWTRWTLRRLANAVEQKFGRKVSRETLRRVLHKAKLSWKKAKKILGRADLEQRKAFVVEIRKLLDDVLRDEQLVLAYIDEAHVHQDADLGYGWSPRGERLYVASSSPGLKAKVSLYGIYVYSEPAVHIWPYERANGVLTLEVLERLRREYGTRPITVVWDGASYHRSELVRAAAERLAITLVRLPPYSPDFMPVEPLWRWLREEVTYNFCHNTPRELIERVERFVQAISRDVCALADRLWVKDELDPEEENLRFST
jgi:transposase